MVRNLKSRESLHSLPLCQAVTSSQSHTSIRHSRGFFDCWVSAARRWWFFFFIPRASFVPVLVVPCGFGDSDSPSVNGLFLGKECDFRKLVSASSPEMSQQLGGVDQRRKRFSAALYTLDKHSQVSSTFSSLLSEAARCSSAALGKLCPPGGLPAMPGLPGLGQAGCPAPQAALPQPGLRAIGPCRSCGRSRNPEL